MEMILIIGNRNVEVVRHFLWLTTVCFLLFVYTYTTFTAVQKCRHKGVGSAFRANQTLLKPKTLEQDIIFGKRSLPSRHQNYTILWHKSPAYFLKKANISLQRCRFNNCRITTELEEISIASAVIFRHNYVPDVPPEKPLEQIWVLFSMESPFYVRRIYQQYQWKHKFNWTITYAKQSDIPMPYATVVKEVNFIRKNYSDIFFQKTGFAASIISHCNAISERDEYIRELQKYIPVDVFGKCGKHYCSRNGTQCMDNISEKYKFYLSFENSLCDDYVTEKVLWMYHQNRNFIPVVRGAPNIDQYVPRKTYINVYDFGSPEILANHLRNIASDEREYTSYLREKDRYKPYFASYYRAMCSLCEKINTYDVLKSVDADNWFSIEPSCLVPQNDSQIYDLNKDEKIPDYWYWD